MIAADLLRPKRFSKTRSGKPANIIKNFLDVLLSVITSMSEFLIFFKSLFSRSRFSSILTSLVVGLSVGLMVLAFNNPTGNPTTGGGVIGVNTGALANSLYIDSLSNVGIGTTNPGAKLSRGSNQDSGGVPGANKILTSTLSGWQAGRRLPLPASLPSGAVFFMISGNCPSGTTDATAAYTIKFAGGSFAWNNWRRRHP